MAKLIRRKSRKKTSKIKIQGKVNKGFLSRIKFSESYTSLVLGAIVFLIVGILFISFAKGNRGTLMSSIKDVPETKLQNSNTSSTYTVNAGDDLWSISEKIYNDGYSWVAIARANKLENPSLIYAGTKLMIPVIISNSNQEESVAQNLGQNLQTRKAIIKNNSIAGNKYTVVAGDSLWDIAVRAYGDGFKWPEIAKVNNLDNPSIIHSGNSLKIPR